MSKLKPCPFCGCDKIRFVERFHVNGGSYDCVECGCSTEYKQTQEQALAVWNTRAESLELATLREQVKVLREALEEASSVLKNCEVTTGYCCCGLRMTPHSYFVNEHIARDFGEYCAELAIKAADKALSQTKPKEGE